MNWPRLVSVAAHAALLGWLYQLSALPVVPRAPEVVRLVELVEPLYRPPPPPAPTAVVEPPKAQPKQPEPPRRARVRPRAAAPPPTAAQSDAVEPLPIPAAEPLPPAAPAEPTDTYIRDPQPVYRPHPEYPERARRFKREGYVELEFTIGVDGRVRDIRILASDPEGVFDRAATKALAKWRYAPQVVGAVAVERPGVRVRIRFRLENA